MEWANKFDTPEQLEKAYLNLQAAFTKKCQLLRETQEAAPTAVVQAPSEEVAQEAVPAPAEPMTAERFATEYPETASVLRMLAVQEYLLDIMRGNPPAPIAANGTPVSPPTRLTSVDQASRVAKRLFE